MVSLTQDMLDAITEKLVAALHPERIYLFGSQAYGSPDPDSDLDLLIVVPDGAPKERDLTIRARQAIGNLGCGVDVLVYTADRFDRRSGWRANFEHTVRNKGRLLYGEDGMAFAREWLRKARNDLQSAKALLQLQPPITDTATFHCQQAVEKLLKGYLTHHNQPFEKLHNLEALVGLCTAFDPAFESIRERASSLNPYAVEPRYPSEREPTQEEAEEALNTVRTIWDFVLERLPGELRQLLNKTP